MRMCGVDADEMQVKLALDVVGLDWSDDFDFDLAVELLKHPQSDVDELRTSMIKSCHRPHIQRNKNITASYSVSDDVILHDGRSGQIQYKGEIHTQTGIWLGIKLH